MTWDDVKYAWDDGWKALEAEALKVYKAALEADPRPYIPSINAFLAALDGASADLRALQASITLLPDGERGEWMRRHRDLQAQWTDLAAGFWADARPLPVEGPSIATAHLGFAPLFVVAGFVIGISGGAWAVAAREYALNLQAQTALARRELDARVEASKQGRQLQPSTLPIVPASPAPPDPAQVGWWLMSGLGLAAGILLLPQLLKRS